MNSELSRFVITLIENGCDVISFNSYCIIYNFFSLLMNAFRLSTEVKTYGTDESHKKYYPRSRLF